MFWACLIIQYGRFFIQVFFGSKVKKIQKIIDPMETINSHIDRVIGVFVEILFSLFGQKWVLGMKEIWAWQNCEAWSLAEDNLKDWQDSLTEKLGRTHGPSVRKKN